MANPTSEFQFGVFLSHSAKDKAVVRPLAGRRTDEPQQRTRDPFLQT